MLAWRILMSAILISAFSAAFWLDHRLGRLAPVLFLVAVALAIRGSWEITSLLQTRNIRPRFIIVCAGSLLMIGASWLGPWLWPQDELGLPPWRYLAPPMIAFTMVVLGLLFLATQRFREPGDSVESLGGELLGICYVGVLLTMTSQLRWVAGAEAGYLVLVSLILATKGGDVGAYFVGRLLGRSRMSPVLSPKKTWWGARGAVLTSSLVSVLWLTTGPQLFDPSWKPCPWPWALLYGGVLGAVGILGDLAESLIKRDVGKKDAATLMPGFGGLLDVLDSVIYAGPVAYLLWVLTPLATWR